MVPPAGAIGLEGAKGNLSSASTKPACPRPRSTAAVYALLDANGLRIDSRAAQGKGDEVIFTEFRGDPVYIETGRKPLGVMAPEPT